MSEKRPSLSAPQSIIAVILTALSLVFTLIFLILLLAVGNGIIRLVMCIVWFISVVLVYFTKNKVHVIAETAITMLMLPAMGFSLLFAPYIHSHSPYKYNLQRELIDVYNRASSKDFPDKLPEDTSDYEFDYLPSMMQGTGHCSARFSSSAEVIEYYESEYASQAIYTIPLSDFKDSYIYYVKDISPKAEQGLDEYPNNTLHIYYDNKFWNDTDATVYVISAVHDFNHPSSYSVIISQDHTKIQFAKQFG